MDMGNVKVTSNAGAILDAQQRATERALEIIGGKAETYAKLGCPVDTGLLRNSITHGLNGGKTSIKSYTDNSGGKAGEYNGNINTGGREKGTAVVVGTNVEYAPFVELGTRKVDPRPFLRPAIEEHIDEYKQVIEEELRRA